MIPKQGKQNFVENIILFVFLRVFVFPRFLLYCTGPGFSA